MKTLNDAEEYELWGYPDTTVVDCDFLVQAFEAYGCNVNAVLDIACGTGRHVIEMARRGYAVTGLDETTGSSICLISSRKNIQQEPSR